MDSSTSTTYQEVDLKRSNDNEVPRSFTEAAYSEEGHNPILELSRTISSGFKDPFACMPINLGPGTHALLDHCRFPRYLK